MLFSNMDFNFAYIPNFNLAHFEIEENYELICLSYKMVDFTCKSPFWVFKRFKLVSSIDFILLILFTKEVFGKFWVKITV